MGQRRTQCAVLFVIECGILCLESQVHSHFWGGISASSPPSVGREERSQVCRIGLEDMQILCIHYDILSVDPRAASDSFLVWHPDPHPVSVKQGG
jgi:hypothetical protein